MTRSTDERRSHRLRRSEAHVGGRHRPGQVLDSVLHATCPSAVGRRRRGPPRAVHRRPRPPSGPHATAARRCQRRTTPGRVRADRPLSCARDSPRRSHPPARRAPQPSAPRSAPPSAAALARSGRADASPQQTTASTSRPTARRHPRRRHGRPAWSSPSAKGKAGVLVGAVINNGPPGGSRHLRRPRRRRRSDDHGRRALAEPARRRAPADQPPSRCPTHAGRAGLDARPDRRDERRRHRPVGGRPCSLPDLYYATRHPRRAVRQRPDDVPGARRRRTVGAADGRTARRPSCGSAASNL